MQNKELQELAQIFYCKGADLFIVGGCTRNELLGIKLSDLDLASQLQNKEIKRLLIETDYEFEIKNNKLGTSTISKGDFKCEHTTFRQEQYKRGGYHLPTKIKFTKDIKKDVKRRDFTCNSIYYNIRTEEYLDYVNGIKDVKNKVMKTVLKPKEVFSRDGLRIIRMVRQAAELGFEIDGKTFKAAQKKINQLDDLSRSRTFKEFEVAIKSDYRYNTADAHLKAIEYICKLDGMQKIFNSLEKYNKNKVNDFCDELKYYKIAKQSNRMEGLIVDLAIFVKKHFEEDKTLLSIAQELTNKQNCYISDDKRESILKTIKAYEGVGKLKTDPQARKFIIKYKKTMSHLEQLFTNENNAFDFLFKNYKYMKDNKIPFSKSDLKIDGHIIQDTVKLKDKKQIGVLLEKCFMYSIKAKGNNTKAKLVEFIKKEGK